MASRFELVLDHSGRFHFQLREAGGGVLLRSLACDSRIMAQHGVLHARGALRDDSQVVPHRSMKGGCFVVVKDTDGSVLARSTRVAHANDLQSLLARIRTASQGAPVVDLTKRAHATH